MTRKGLRYLCAAAGLALVLSGCGGVHHASQSIRLESNVRYGSADGQPLLLDAYGPSASSKSKFPAVVVIHGGGAGGGPGDKADLSPEAQAFARAGFVAFSVNFRRDYPAALDDIEAAVRWIRNNSRRFRIDPHRIVAFGVSKGGLLAGLLATDGTGSLGATTRVRAAAIWSGIFDLRSFVADTPGSGLPNVVTNFLGCTVAACPRVAIAASPVSHVDSTDPPMFLANSRHEIIPLSQSMEMVRALRRNRVEARLLMYPGNRHATAYAAAAWTKTLHFLKTNDRISKR